MLTGKQKSYLKGLAHTMQPIIQVGKNGVNDALIKTVYDALEARELIKVSIVFYKESSKKKQIVIPK